ncbi:MAG: hypothetical protein SVX43_10670 [Cyanobacteriota bacterium]|nr:hypothetical protein [Cyanobacteriota bacterium]
MRRWILWLLVLVVGFFSALGSSALSHEIVAAETVEVPTGSLQTVEGDSDNAVEVNGVQFEILIPERTWVIPDSQIDGETPVDIGIHTATYLVQFVYSSQSSANLCSLSSEMTNLSVNVSTKDRRERSWTGVARTSLKEVHLVQESF